MNKVGIHVSTLTASWIKLNKRKRALKCFCWISVRLVVSKCNSPRHSHGYFTDFFYSRIIHSYSSRSVVVCWISFCQVLVWFLRSPENRWNSVLTVKCRIMPLAIFVQWQVLTFVNVSVFVGKIEAASITSTGIFFLKYYPLRTAEYATDL